MDSETNLAWVEQLYRRHQEYKGDKGFELFCNLKSYVKVEFQKTRFTKEKRLDNGLIYAGCLNRHNQPHGIGLVIKPDKSIFEGHFLDGKVSGKGRLVKADGSYIEGDWSGDVVIGHCHVLYADGTEYTGDVVDNTPNGFGRIHWEDGSWYEGNFNKGLKEGSGRMRWASGK